MNFYSELARMQHHGQEELAEQIEERLRCCECNVMLTDYELEAYGELCKRCYEGGYEI